MPCAYRLLSAAEVELHAICDYYDGQAPGLGEAFFVEVAATIGHICHYPESFPLEDNTRSVRRATVGRFPYNVFYSFRHDEVIVVCIYHAARRPGAWRSR